MDDKIQFFKFLNLEVNKNPKILSDHTAPSYYVDILDKNNRTIITGYDNFCLQKGTTKLIPSEDFVFSGKFVVCLKCSQKFDSRMSYCAHVDTDFCIRTYNKPNLVYLKYKKKKNKRWYQYKNNCMSSKDSNDHDINKFTSNLEMLNTLQTRNKSYSDSILEFRKFKQAKKGSNKKYEVPAKKRRGILSESNENNSIEQGRPIKPKTKIKPIVNKFTSNLEMLNTLQTRNKSYSDSILEFRKFKQAKKSSNKKYEVPAKKRSGILSESNENHSIEQGRPIKPKTKIKPIKP